MEQALWQCTEVDFIWLPTCKCLPQLSTKLCFKISLCAQLILPVYRNVLLHAFLPYYVHTILDWTSKIYNFRKSKTGTWDKISEFCKNITWLLAPRKPNGVDLALFQWYFLSLW